MKILLAISAIVLALGTQLYIKQARILCHMTFIDNFMQRTEEDILAAVCSELEVLNIGNCLSPITPAEAETAIRSLMNKACK